MQQHHYIMKIALLSHSTALSQCLFRNGPSVRILAAATMLLLCLTSAAHARQADSAVVAPTATASRDQIGDPGSNLPLPRIMTYAPAGFRFYRPGYRLVGKGALVSAQLCRLPGYASASPQHLRIERLDPVGRTAESHEQYLTRLGMRVGNNCSFAGLRLASVPTYGETIKICATSGRGTCP